MSTKVREMIREVERDGWRLARTKGSHRQFKHPTKLGKVTIAGHPSDDLDPGTEEKHPDSGGNLT